MNLTPKATRQGLGACPFCGLFPEHINFDDVETTCAPECPCADLQCKLAAWNTRVEADRPIVDGLVEAAEAARLLIGEGGQGEHLHEAIREGNLNQAWHLLNNALAAHRSESVNNG